MIFLNIGSIALIFFVLGILVLVRLGWSNDSQPPADPDRTRINERIQNGPQEKTNHES